ERRNPTTTPAAAQRSSSAALSRLLRSVPFPRERSQRPSRRRAAFGLERRRVRPLVLLLILIAAGIFLSSFSGSFSRVPGRGGRRAMGLDLRVVVWTVRHARRAMHGGLR